MKNNNYEGLILWLTAIILLCVIGFGLENQQNSSEQPKEETQTEEKIDVSTEEPESTEIPEDNEDGALDEPKDEENIRYEGVSVLFPTLSADLDEEDKKDIDRIMKDVNNDNVISITIDGYADSRGTYDDNMVLSENRAVAVCTYIANKYGVSEDKITVKGHSEDNPVGDNNTAEGRQLNRRSDIVIKFHDNGGIE